MKRALLLTSLCSTLLLSTLGGCASLEITVDVYDGPLLIPPDSAQATSTAVSASGLCSWEAGHDSQARLRELIRPEIQRLESMYVSLQVESMRAARGPAEPEDIDAAEEGYREQARELWCSTDCFDDTARGVGVDIIAEWASGPAQRLPAVCEHNEVLAKLLDERNTLATTRRRLTKNQLEQALALDEAIANRRDLLARAIASYEGELATFTTRSVTAYIEPDAPVGADSTRFEITLASLQLGADRQSGIAAEGPVNGRVAGYPIFDPVFLQVLRNSKLDMPDPNVHWSPMIRTKSWASGGNNQFVMVRQGLLVFHQKSLDFDPTPIIGAASASARLGLMVASQLASGATGVPLPKPGGGANPQDGDAELPASEAEIELLRRRIARLDEAEREALRELAQLLDDLDELAPDDEQGRAAILARLDVIIRRFQGRVDRK